MSCDLFISYSRRDNEQGRITQLVERNTSSALDFAKQVLARAITLAPGNESYRKLHADL